MMIDFLSKCVLPIIIHRSMFSSNYGLDFLEPLISLMTRIFTQIGFLDAHPSTSSETAQELTRIGWRKMFLETNLS